MAERRAPRPKKGTPPKSGDGGALASLVSLAAFASVAIGALRNRGDAAERPDVDGGEAPLVVVQPTDVPLPPSTERRPPSPLLRRFDAWQRQRPAVAFPLAVVRKFGDDRAGYLAALVSYFAFFSLFPLLLALTSILGFVLEGNPDLQQDLQESATDQIPIIGDQLTVGTITGSVVAIVVGVGVALWSGLKVIDAAQNALNDVWDVPVVGRPTFAKRRVKSVLLLGVIGLSLIGSLAAGSIAGLLPDLPGVGRFGVLAVTLLFNVGVFLLAFKLLPEARLRWGELLPGSIFAGVGWWVLQTSGAVYIQRTIENAGPTYNTFATVIGLLTFFFLASQLVILGAEINVVRSRRLYPRSLLAAHGELTDADRQVYADSAGATRRLADQRVQVGFRNRPPD
ncbi:MAG: YihY/virulence factor BrkB family protein [Acidimicrobiia bacterium]